MWRLSRLTASRLCCCNVRFGSYDLGAPNDNRRIMDDRYPCERGGNDVTASYRSVQGVETVVSLSCAAIAFPSWRRSSLTHVAVPAILRRSPTTEFSCCADPFLVSCSLPRKSIAQGARVPSPRAPRCAIPRRWASDGSDPRNEIGARTPKVRR